MMLRRSVERQEVKAMKGNNPVRQQFTTLAFQLDQYNNGVTGPGHCTE